MAVLGLPEHVNLGLRLQEHPEHGRASQPVAAVGSPGGDHAVGAGRLGEQVVVVGGPDGVRVLVESPGIGRAQREEVAHDEPGEAPALRITDATADGRIVPNLVGRARVQADEQHRVAALPERALQRVPVPPILREDGPHGSSGRYWTIWRT